MRRSEAIALMTLLLLAPTLAIGSSSPGRIRPRIVNGVATTQFPTVGALLYGTDFDTASMICSGTLIGCETFLTAAHCVEDDLDPARYSVYLQHAGLFAVASVASHPDYDFPVGDLAVLRLATPVTGIPPTRIDTVGTFGEGSPATIAGFGNTGGGNDDYGLKRAGAITVAECTTGISDATSVCWNFVAPLGPPGTDSSTCNGDSGGPMFVDLGSGPTVAGITSGGNNFDCLPDDVSFDTRVYVYRSFIQGIGGADLANATCGTIPQLGSADATVLGFSGQVSAADTQGHHSFSVSPGTQTLRIAMNAHDDGAADFDLYVKFGSPPSTTDYDCRRNGSNQYAFCEFDAPASGTWHVLVSRWAGSGQYQATVTTFRPFCGNPANAGLPCDDQNACTSGETCQAGTCTGTVVPNDTPCDDGRICTRGDRCQGGACVPAAAPAIGCKRPVAAGKSTLFLKNDAGNPGRNRLTWRWGSGASTDKSEFGDPTAGDSIGICLYDDRGSGPELVIEHEIPAGANWTHTRDGYKYADRALAHGGVRSILLRSSPTDGRAAIAVKAQGDDLGVDLPLLKQPTVRMQLVAEGGCWEAVYSTQQQSSAERFKARSD
jgi:secreted trypsin-like serine protease